MLLSDVVGASAQVRATRSRLAKKAVIADLLRQARDGEPGDLELVTSYVSGVLPQRRTGLGWRGLTTLPTPAGTATLGVEEVHRTFDELAALAGPGSQRARADAVATLFARATAEEQAWLRGIVTGELRQGALDALVQEAVAQAADVPLPRLRRAAMLAGSTVAVVEAAFSGGVEALDEVALEVGRPILPMLASSAADVGAALEKLGGGPVAVDTKLDGIRIQVHRAGDDVLVVTRSLDDITSRLPDVVAAARALPASSFVLDGEALTLDVAGRPRPFQETASRTATREAGADQDGGVRVSPYFFDLLHLDGRDLLDEPWQVRADALRALVPEPQRVAGLVTSSLEDATAFATEAVAAGHEGVVVKAVDAPYAAGRRGAAWVKVKPVHTVDLVVLAVEWGSGRRTGWLSNLHLGARDPERRGEFVMLGKTFKGMTDEMLAWQTERFLGLETSRTAHTVHVRPEQVVEIAFDGVQRSTRYPGGVALRFARVVGYRDDKTASEADTIETMRGFL